MVRKTLGASVALFIVVLVVMPPTSQSLGFGLLNIRFKDIKQLMSFTWEVYTRAETLKSTWDTLMDDGPSLGDISKQISNVANSISAMDQKIESKLAAISDDVAKITSKQELSDGMTELLQHTSRIDTLYGELLFHLKLGNNTNNTDLQRYAIDATSTHVGAVTDTIAKILDIFVPKTGAFSERSLLHRLENDMQENFVQLCDARRSPQEFVYEIYNNVMMSETKAMIINIIAYKVLEMFDNEPGKYKTNVEGRFEAFLNRSDGYMKIFEAYMKTAKRAIRRCDPVGAHKRLDTFLEFYRFIGYTLMQEEATNVDNYYTGRCDHYGTSKQGFGCGDGYGCDRIAEACYGRVSDCTDTSGYIDACLGDWANHSPRRYEWIKNSYDDKRFGNVKGECAEKSFRHLTWQRYGGYHGDLCRCTCVEDTYEGRSNHFVSLRPVTTSIRDNMVVTGIKFTKINSTVQIQIQEGKLIGSGKIEGDTAEWKTPEKLAYDKKLSESKKKHVFVKIYENNTYEELTTGIDIGVFTQDDRTINLDELHVPKDHVITGVRFSRAISEGKICHPIQLEIRATLFDYKTGKLKLLNEDYSSWISSQDVRAVAETFDGNNVNGIVQKYKGPRQQIVHHKDAKNPVDAPIKATPIFRPNRYIQLDKSGLDGDFGQTVLPLLDALPVAPKPPLPLTGLNLFHKAAPGYGGFLSFQIFTVDRSDRMQFNRNASLTDQNFG